MGIACQLSRPLIKPMARPLVSKDGVAIFLCVTESGSAFILTIGGIPLMF